jgi:2-dehydro-3-deoxy-D-arabinonate dehydratase
VAEYVLDCPLTSEEVWGAGLTYKPSRDARVEESSPKGGEDHYNRAYTARRPEIFFKATASRVVGPGRPIVIRSDSAWSVPEPELALWLDSELSLIGYSLANDVTARDIEAENPLYLPQAKIYAGSCALGPFVAVSADPALARSFDIMFSIRRGGQELHRAQISTSRMVRQVDELIGALRLDNTFSHGVVLMTGTGLVPPDDIRLEDGDEVTISAEGLGVLSNTVQRGSSRE